MQGRMNKLQNVNSKVKFMFIKTLILISCNSLKYYKLGKLINNTTIYVKEYREIQ